MAEFEELRLTVNLVDNASAGLQRIRAEIGQLNQTAGQMVTSFNQSAAALTNVGSAATKAAPALRTASTEMRSLEGSAKEAGRGLGDMFRTMQMGAGGLPQLAYGAYNAAQGLSGMSKSLETLVPGAGRAAIVLGGVALGITAVGVAAVAYGVSVFRFAREMEALSKTAKAMGASFAEVKLATEHARQYGLSQEAAIQNLAGLQKAQLDLARNNSQLRQEMVGKGLDPNWLNQFSRETEEWRAQNMVREKGLAIQKELEAKGWNRRAARGQANEFAQSLGFDKGIYDRPGRVAPTAKELEDLARLEKQSEAIDKIWGDIDKKWQSLSTRALSAGLPGVQNALENIAAVMDRISAATKFISEAWSRFNSSLQSGSEKMNKLLGIDPSQLTDDELRAKGLEPVKPRTEQENNTLRENRVKPSSRFDRYQPTSFGGDDLADETGRNATETARLTNQLEKLNAYFDRATGRTGGGGGGGFQNAAFTTSGAVGGGSGGASAASFGSAEYPNLGGGGGGGGGGNPAVGGSVPQSLGGGQTGSGGTADPSVPSEVLARAKQVALQSGPGGVDAFMRSQGYPKAGAWCGQFAASVVKSEGGTPPQNPAIASNWRNWGTPVDSPQPGDVAVRKGVRTGSTGSHVTFVEGGVDPKTGRFAAIGGNQGRFQTSYPASQYEFRRGGAPNGQTAGPGTGAGAGDTAAGAGSGGSEFLAQQRSHLKKELDDNPELKRRFAALVDLENPGAGTAVAESAMNRAAMSGRSMESILQGGPKSFYGPARKGLVGPRMAALSRNPDAMAARMRQIDEAAGGSNVTRGATDQGSAGDPNYSLGGTGVNINGERFNDFGGFRGTGYSRRWREAQQSNVDRSALSRATEVNATGKLSVDVNAPPGTKVEASGGGLFKDTQLQRSTQMPYTHSGPSASETANQYMASR